MITTDFSKQYEKRKKRYIDNYFWILLGPIMVLTLSLILSSLIGSYSDVIYISNFVSDIYALELNAHKALWLLIGILIYLNTKLLKKFNSSRTIDTTDMLELTCQLISEGKLDKEAVRTLSLRKYPKFITH